MRTYSFLAATVAAVLASAAAATPLTIGTGTGGNAFPFGGSFNANPTTYQQVYASSSFGTSPVKITGISFVLQSGSVSSGTYSLSLSTTSKAVDGLDTSVFANNIGGDNTWIYSGTLAGQLSGGVLSFSFAPFTYKPSTGNLLLDVNVSGVPSGFSGFFLANNGDAGGLFSRAHDFGSQFDEWGLQTTFEVGPGVPEPGVWLMMIGGFGLVGVTLRARKATTAAA